MTAYNIKVLKSEDSLTVVHDDAELYNFLITANTKNAAKKIALKEAKTIVGILEEKLQQQKWIEEGAIRFKAHGQLKKATKKAVKSSFK